MACVINGTYAIGVGTTIDKKVDNRDSSLLGSHMQRSEKHPIHLCLKGRDMNILLSVATAAPEVGRPYSIHLSPIIEKKTTQRF